jgi:hypothetical protein
MPPRYDGKALSGGIRMGFVYSPKNAAWDFGTGTLAAIIQHSGDHLGLTARHNIQKTNEPPRTTVIYPIGGYFQDD